MRIKAKTKYLNEEANLQWDKYLTGEFCLTLIGVKFPEPLSRATICLEEYNIFADPKKREVVIKESQENEGMVQTLLDAKVIESIISWHDAGYVKKYAAKCLLTTNAYEDAMLALFG